MDDAALRKLVHFLTCEECDRLMRELGDALAENERLKAQIDIDDAELMRIRRRCGALRAVVYKHLVEPAVGESGPADDVVVLPERTMPYREWERLFDLATNATPRPDEGAK